MFLLLSFLSFSFFSILEEREIEILVLIYRINNNKDRYVWRLQRWLRVAGARSLSSIIYWFFFLLLLKGQVHNSILNNNRKNVKKKKKGGVLILVKKEETDSQPANQQFPSFFNKIPKTTMIIIMRVDRSSEWALLCVKAWGRNNRTGSFLLLNKIK